MGVQTLGLSVGVIKGTAGDTRSHVHSYRWGNWVLERRKLSQDLTIGGWQTGSLILMALPGTRIYESLSTNAACAAMLRNINFMMRVRCTRKDLGWFMKENKGGGEEASLRWAWANMSLTLFHSLCAHGPDALHTSIFNSFRSTAKVNRRYRYSFPYR